MGVERKITNHERRTTNHEKTGLYMYSVISSNGDRSFGPIGLSEDPEKGEEAYTILYKDIACVVSRSAVKEWDISRVNMLKHQKVNEEVMREHLTLPIKFCTIAETQEQIVEKFLRGRYKEFCENLSYFADKQEYGVRALWTKMEPVYAELMEGYPELRKWRDRLSQLPFEKARNDMIILGEEVKEALQQKKENLEAELFERLRPGAVEAKSNKLVGDRMVLNGVFLVAHQNQADFDAKVNLLTEEYKDRLQFKYVGPTPPANFIEIVVHWE